MFWRKEKEMKEMKEMKEKVIEIKIIFYDGNSEMFECRYHMNSNITYITAYYDFYKWFFHRENSEIYSFRHRDGAKIFYRKDIQRIEFKIIYS